MLFIERYLCLGLEFSVGFRVRFTVWNFGFGLEDFCWEHPSPTQEIVNILPDS